VEPVLHSRRQRREVEGAQATATHHVVTNQSIEFTDRNSAVVRAYWMFVVAHGANKPMSIESMGSSEDYLIRKDGKWLIRDRRVAPQTPAGRNDPGRIEGEYRVFQIFILFTMNSLYTGVPKYADPEEGARRITTQVADKV
jgi:hypothetical protein